MVVGERAGEPLQVLDEPVPLPLDPDQGRERQRIVRRRMEAAAGRIVPEQPRGREVGRDAACGREALQGVSDAVQDGFKLMRHRADT